TPSHPLPHSFPTRRSSDLEANDDGQPQSRVLRPRVEADELIAAAVLLDGDSHPGNAEQAAPNLEVPPVIGAAVQNGATFGSQLRSEEHTSELQSRGHLVCR